MEITPIEFIEKTRPIIESCKAKDLGYSIDVNLYHFTTSYTIRVYKEDVGEIFYRPFYDYTEGVSLDDIIRDAIQAVLNWFDDPETIRQNKIAEIDAKIAKLQMEKENL